MGLGGKRALVTGASSGIGAAIARQLAAQGVHVVLTARRKDQLEAVASECRTHGVRVDVITSDLGAPEAAHALWLAATAGGAIDICVNNAGFGYFRPFAEIEWERDAEMLQLNITSLVQLSLLFVRARTGSPGRAYLLNIASIGAYQSVPMMAVYASTKAFVRNFTEALHDELAGSPVSATCVCPGGTKTEFHANAGAGNYGWIANASMMSAEGCAKIAIRAMERGKRTVIPGLINKLSCFGVRLVPRWFASWMSRRVLGKPRPGALPSRSAGSAA
jgi:short-subunit dehydrogenase